MHAFGGGACSLVADWAFLVVEATVPNAARSGAALAAELGPFPQAAGKGNALNIGEGRRVVLLLVLVSLAEACRASVSGAEGPVAGGAAQGRGSAGAGGPRSDRVGGPFASASLLGASADAGEVGVVTYAKAAPASGFAQRAKAKPTRGVPPEGDLTEGRLAGSF